MKKIISVLIVSAMLLTALCSCSNDSSDTSSQVAESQIESVVSTVESEVTSEDESVSSEPEKEKKEEKKEEEQTLTFTVKYDIDKTKNTVHGGDGTVEMVNVDVDCPVFTITRSDGKGAQMVSDLINERLEVAAYNISELSDQYASDAQSDYEQNGWVVPYEITNTCRVERSDNYISVVYNTYTYLGGAHGSESRSTFTFLTETAEKLELSDIVTNKSGFIKAAKKSIIAELDSDKYNPDENYKEQLDDILADPVWYLSNKGIVIIFSEYQIAPYSEGTYEITVPYSAVANYLTEGVAK